MPIATAPQTPHPHLPAKTLGVLSSWQRSTRDHPLLNKGKDDPLPEDADVVIIGSGLCSAMTAHTLLKAANRPKKIVVLEAREICSGASGRNAGHCRPDAARGFPAFSSVHGPESTLQVMSSETVVRDRLDEFIRQHNIDCEWNLRDTYDVCLTDEFKDYSANALREMRAAGGKPVIDVLDAEEAKKETRVAETVGAYKWKAATINPAKLTLKISEMNTAMGGYELYAWTPAHGVRQAGDGTSWVVQTSRGNVKAGKVVFATNAYSQSVVPELKDLVVPTRAQAILATPPPVGSEAFPPIKGSYSLRFLPKEFYSVAPRPDQTIVIGTSRGWKGMPESVRESMMNTVDDSAADPIITKNSYETFCRLLPEGGWSTEGLEEGTAKGFDHAWAGIIAMTPDAVPFVGPIPGKEGQFVAAGYNGHGMARIMLCAPALAKYMLHGEWDPEMPEAFKITEERLERLKVALQKAQLSQTGGAMTNAVV
ncbi:hypothetical protein P7C73_g1922, partial [Tremellales sp. Uapishka_1]